MDVLRSRNAQAGELQSHTAKNEFSACARNSAPYAHNDRAEGEQTMAGQPTRILNADSAVDFGDNVGITIPVKALLEAQTAEASAQGMVVWNGKSTIKLIDVPDVDGHPMQFTVTLRAVRSAKDANEYDAIERAKTDADGRRTKKATEETNKRENEIMRTANLVKSTLIEANRERGDLATQIKSAHAVVQALQGLGQKQIG